jgi:cytochrome c oxidase subunit 2
VAVRPGQFDAWLANLRKDAAVPASAAAREGQRLFMAGPCAACHTIAGTPAAGQVGPDLTHLASRGALAAETLPNLRGDLRRWVHDPQAVKQGVHMPASGMSDRELDAVVAFLEGLR